MAHKKNPEKRVNYKAIGKRLKDLGFVDYDLRKELNNGQKAQITKLQTEYSYLLNHPEAFHVQKAPKGTKSGLRTAGYKVNKGGKAIIPLHEYHSAKIQRGQVVLKSPHSEETVYLAGSRQFFDKLKNLNEIKGKLKRNQMLTVQIGDNNTFGKARYRSYWELYQYLTKWQPKDEGESREKLFAKMSLVTITTGETNGKRRK